MTQPTSVQPAGVRGVAEAPPAVVVAPRGPRLWHASVVLLVFGIAVMGFARTTADPDLWGHLRFGLDLLETGRVARPDPYSYLTAGVLWVNHEWLAEALMAIAWRAAGATGLVLLKLSMVVALVAILLGHLRRRIRGHAGASAMSVLGASMIVLAALPILLPWLGAVRPQMFTYVCFAITLVAIARAEEGAPRALWVLPPVFAAWANLHGGFLAGGGICALWLIARAAQHLARRGVHVRDREHGRTFWRAELRTIILPVIVAGLATLVTPYAGQLWIFLRTALVSRLEIVEWNPIEMTSLEGLAYLVLLAPSAAALIWSRREKRPPLVFLYMCVVLLPLMARRHTPLFAIALVVLTGEHLADAAARMFRRQDEHQDERLDTRHDAHRDERVPGAVFAPPTWMAGAFIALAGACVALSLTHVRQIVFDREVQPVEAVKLLASSGVRTNIATAFAWGEYLIWHVGPAIKVSIDGRRETVYPEPIYEETMRFSYGYGKWDAVLNHPGVDLALVPTQDWPTRNLLHLQPGWTILYEDDRSALFGREGSEVTARLRALPRPERAADTLTFP